MRTMARALCEASEGNLKNLQDKRNCQSIVFADQEQNSEPGLKSFSEEHMTLKDVSERRTAGRRIRGAFKNLRMYESPDEHAQTHPKSPKRRRSWTFFLVGWAAGTIGFVLLFFR